MKNILILLLLSISCFAQTKLDSLVFNKVNEYRASKGLSKISWDTAAFKASKCHSDYLEGLAAKTNYTVITAGHSENAKGLEDAEDRFIHFGGKTKYVGEIVLINSSNLKDNDADKLDKLATSLVKQWKDSPKHNEIMLTPNFNFGGISCKIITRPAGLRGITNYETWSTFVFAKIPD
jgi:uncharacterized protein YkwD